jgi:hypothetical protein
MELQQLSPLRAYNLLRSLSLGAQLGDLQGSAEERACALRIHALGVLADLDDGGEAILAVSDFDISRFVENVNRGFVGHTR